MYHLIVPLMVFVTDCDNSDWEDNVPGAENQPTVLQIPHNVFRVLRCGTSQALQALMVPFRTPCYYSNLQQSNAPKRKSENLESPEENEAITI